MSVGVSKGSWWRRAVALMFVGAATLMPACGGGGGGDSTSGGGSTTSSSTSSGGGGSTSSGGSAESGSGSGGVTPIVRSQLTLLAGNVGGRGSADGVGAAARFDSPGGIATDQAGNVYVADTNNSTIRKITPDGVVSTLAGKAGSPGLADGTGAEARFQYPRGIVTDSVGNVYVADTDNQRIRKITPSGVVTMLLPTLMTSLSYGTNYAAYFDRPAGLAIDRLGYIYLADGEGNKIYRLSPTGQAIIMAGGSYYSPGSTDGVGSAAKFSSPTGIAVDSNGYVYVADTDNGTIRRITPSGEATTVAGTPGVTGAADGTGSAASFHFPQGVAVDRDGIVYVADTDNGTIRKMTPDGVVTTFAGVAQSPGFADGTGSAARFSAPKGIATDAAGNLYVADSGNHVIRKVTPAGAVSTLAGSVAIEGSADGAGVAARFTQPAGIAVERRRHCLRYRSLHGHSQDRFGWVGNDVAAGYGNLWCGRYRSRSLGQHLCRGLPRNSQSDVWRSSDNAG